MLIINGCEKYYSDENLRIKYRLLEILYFTFLSYNTNVMLHDTPDKLLIFFFKHQLILELIRRAT